MKRNRITRTEPVSESQKKRDREIRAKYANKPSLDKLSAEEFGPTIKQGEYLALMHFFSLLKSIRERQNLSLADIAARTGIDKSAISRLENGLTENPTIATLERLARSVGKRIRIELEDN
jgi:DNA-binding XRE family transcriptional regulator